MMATRNPGDTPREPTVGERIRQLPPIRAFSFLRKMKPEDLEGLVKNIHNTVGQDTKRTFHETVSSYVQLINEASALEVYAGTSKDELLASIGLVGQQILGLADAYQQNTIAQEEAFREYIRQFAAKATELTAKTTELKETKERYLAAARENQELLEEMMTDKVSGARSRRYFFKRLTEDLIPFAERHNDPLSVVAFDLNKFKQANDIYGHAAGDYVLKEIVNLATGVFGKPNIVGRLGGDEFIIAAPQLNEEEAFRQTEVLREKVAGHQFEYSEIVTERDKKYEVIYGIPITLAAGVRQHEKGISADELCKGADRAFYVAHALGKNKTITFTDFMKQYRDLGKDTSIRPARNIISRMQVE